MRRLQTLLVLCAFTVAGCSCLEKVAYWGITTAYRVKPRHIELSDGYEALYYSFVRGDPDSVDTFLFFIPGSNRASLAFTPCYLKDLPGHVHVFALQKRYICDRCSHVSKPPDEYYQTHYFSNFLNDEVEFITTMLSRQETVPERVVIFGVSAGGTMAGAIAVQIPEINHVAVLGEGGMKGIDYFRIWGDAHGHDFDEIYEMVKSEPTTERMWGGYTYRYWFELLEAEPMQHLGQLDIPLLFAMGENDALESLDYLREQFEGLGRDNLTTIVYSGCDHVLEDSDGVSHRAEFLEDMHDWLHATSSSGKIDSNKN